MYSALQCVPLYVPHAHFAIESEAVQISQALPCFSLVSFSSMVAPPRVQVRNLKTKSFSLLVSSSVQLSSGCIKPVGTFVSQQTDVFPPHQCADSNTTTICVVPEARAPWLALDLGRGAHVERVEISSREDCCGESLRNFQVRVTGSLPPSGAPLVFS